MSFFNVYSKYVRDAQLGSPAQSSDITDGFFKWSLDPRTHSVKSEATYNDLMAYFVVDDAVWEVYEANNGDPVLWHRASERAYNALTDLVITKGGEVFIIELIKDGKIENDKKTIGLAIRDKLNVTAKNITEFDNA